MRVLVLTHNYPRFAGDPAGAFVARLARASQAAGHETRVVAPHVPGTAGHEVDGGVTVTRFRYAPERLERVGYTGSLHRDALSKPLVALALPAYFWRFRRAARRALRDFRPDVVHAHWWVPSGAVAATLGTPFLVTSHGSDVRLLENVPPARLLARRVLRQPQPASSELELAWDDAFRADTFRALWMFGSITAWLAVAAAGLGLLQGLDAIAGTTWSTGLGSQLFTWGFLVILFSFSFGRAQSYFRFRLWPDLVLESSEAASSERSTAS